MPKRKKRSEAWKDLEKLIAKKANEYGLTGRRISRGANFAKKAVDAKVKEALFIKFDAKRYQKFFHHTILAEVKRKYCTGPRHVEAIVTKTPNQTGAYVTIPIDFFMWLLAEVFGQDEGKKKERWYTPKKKRKARE